MSDEIVNRVSGSKLRTFDLEELYPQGPRSVIDLSQWLLEGMVLVESRFRESLRNTDFSIYKDHYIALQCSTDAIVPQWAWMLVQIELTPYAKEVVHGTFEDLETALYSSLIDGLEVETYRDLPVIVKGCSNKPVPVAAYLMITQKLQPVARSIMYGEACSSVPVYKRKKV
ncbi:MAG: DUF2480 family protein [Nonlabens sp.]